MPKIKTFDVYVDPVNGDDSNPGTPKLPMRSMEAANSKIPPRFYGTIRFHLAKEVVYKPRKRHAQV